LWRFSPQSCREKLFPKLLLWWIEEDICLSWCCSGTNMTRFMKSTGTFLTLRCAYMLLLCSQIDI
jgi:hypothetical protein